jgi:hypothetical protein
VSSSAVFSVFHYLLYSFQWLPEIGFYAIADYVIIIIIVIVVVTVNITALLSH